MQIRDMFGVFKRIFLFYLALLLTFSIFYLCGLRNQFVLFYLAIIGFLISIPVFIIQEYRIYQKDQTIQTLQTDIELGKRLQPIFHDCSHCSKLRDQRLVKELRQKIIENTELLQLLPICANCHKIRDDHGYWNQLEEFLKKNAHLDFSHGYCPECTAKLLKDISI